MSNSIQQISEAYAQHTPLFMGPVRLKNAFFPHAYCVDITQSKVLQCDCACVAAG